MNPNQNIQVRDSILQQVKQVLLSSTENLPIVIYLFGSWAKGTEKRSSDIDIAIWYDPPLPLGTLTMLRSNLEDSTIPYRFDIVDLTKAEPSLVQKIKEEGILWKDYRSE